MPAVVTEKASVAEEQLTRGWSGVSRDILRSWQSLTTSLPQAAVTAMPLQEKEVQIGKSSILTDLQRDRVRVPLTAPKNILLSVHLVTLSLTVRCQFIRDESP